MLEIELYKAIGLFLLSGVKILFTPIGMIFGGVPYWTTILITASGGVTKQNRRTVNIKNRFGLIGMASLMGIISVPAAVILVAKYYGKHKAVIPVLILTAVAWSFVVTTVTYAVFSLF
jgi:hypothetical protein